MEVRSWYGLTGTIQVEQELWHLVKVAGIALPHPPLINLVLRQGQTRRNRLHLSFLHEFGHLQTLPLALLHLLWLIVGSRQRSRSGSWPARLLALVLAHQALWEATSEGYVMAEMGKAYWASYQHAAKWPLPVFWLTMGTLAFGLSRWLLSEPDRGMHEPNL